MNATTDSFAHAGQSNPRPFLRRSLEEGYPMWVSYFNRETEGYVLEVGRKSFVIQDSSTRELHTILYTSINEMVEA